MIVSLTDEELSTIVCGLTMTPKPPGAREREAAVIWKLAFAKQANERHVAESTPLGLVLRMKRLP